jgi:dCMP deaminase
MNKWDRRFLNLAELVGSWSKDSTKVGCVVIGTGRSVLTLGYNGFPRGIDDEVESRQTRPIKYLYTEHAERNAIYNAARNGTILNGGTLYSNLFPCADCARAIVQVGINRVVTPQPDFSCQRWGVHFIASTTIFSESGVAYEYI